VRRQAGLHRVVLDVSPDSLALQEVAHRVVVRFGLPKRLAGALQQLVGLSRRVALQSLHEPARGYPRQRQQMHVIRHDRERLEVKVPQLFGVVANRFHQEPGDGFLSQE
jgi:hypothetical protein